MSLNAVPPVLAAHVLAALGVGSITGALGGTSPEQRTRTQAAGAGVHPEGACDR